MVSYVHVQGGTRTSQDVYRKQLNLQRLRGQDWSLHLLNKAYCSSCRRYGSWDRLNICLPRGVHISNDVLHLF